MSGEERRVPVPAGYKMTEVGVIPEDWGVNSLGSMSSVTTGRKDVNEGVPWGRYPFFTCSSGISASESWSFDAEAILVAGNGDVGMLHYYSGKFEAYQRTYVISQFTGLAPYVWQQMNFRLKRALGIGTIGSSIPYIKKGDLTSFLIPTPPLPEQRAIAEALSDVDDLLDALDRLIAKKRAVKQAAMQQLLTGKTRLPGFAGEWEETTLGDHVEFLNNGSQSRSQLSTQGSVRYVHYGDIHLMKTSYLDVSQQGLPFVDRQLVENLSRLKDGDTIFADASEDLQGVGKAVELRSVGRHEVVSGLHTIVARFDPQIIAIGFPAFMQYHPDFRQQLERLASGTKVYAVTSSQIATIKLRIPPLAEQRAIAEVLSDMDDEITALEKRRDKTRRIKEGMMQQLLTGRVRLVPAADPLSKD